MPSMNVNQVPTRRLFAASIPENADPAMMKSALENYNIVEVKRYKFENGTWQT
jgi:hypothetical protein